MAIWRKHGPGCPCGCVGGCDNTCFNVTGCCSNISGASVSVFATSTPGTILASGTTDGSGNWCVDLSSYVGTSLSATITATGYQSATQVLLGSYCGRTYAFPLTPAIPTGGTSGRLTVTLRDETNTLITSGESRVFRVTNLVTPIAVANHNGSGQAVFTGLPTGVALVFNSGPTSGSAQTFPEFTLTCEGTAEAKEADEFGEGQTWSFTSVACSDGLPRLCCKECSTTTLTRAMCVSDPAGPTVTGGLVDINCSTASYSGTMAGRVDGSTCYSLWMHDKGNNSSYTGCDFQVVGYPPPPLTVGVVYTMVCGQPFGAPSEGVYLKAIRAVYCTSTGPYGGEQRCGAPCRFAVGIPRIIDVVPVVVDSGWIEATSVTCSPFSATFDMPGYSVTCYSFDPANGWVATGTQTFGGRTITVTEGACS